MLPSDLGWHPAAGRGSLVGATAQLSAGQSKVRGFFVTQRDTPTSVVTVRDQDPACRGHPIDESRRTGPSSDHVAPGCA